jgi:argininosuccinate lyase
MAADPHANLNDDSETVDPAPADRPTAEGGIAGGGALWHGRFGSGPAESLMAYTESISFDRRLLFDDVTASQAHVRGLARGGLLDADEERAVLEALEAVAAEERAGRLVAHADDEDIHTLIERRVTELAGPAGRQVAHRPQPQRPGGHRLSPVEPPGDGRAGCGPGRAWPRC